MNMNKITIDPPTNGPGPAANQLADKAPYTLKVLENNMSKAAVRRCRELKNQNIINYLESWNFRKIIYQELSTF